MQKNTNTFQWMYLTGFAIILALPLLLLPPWFFPADFGKSIMFKITMTLMLCLFAWQYVYQRNHLELPPIKKNGIALLLALLFGTFFLATVFSVDPYFSLWGSPTRAGGLVNLAFYIPFTMLGFFLLKEKDWQKAWDFSLVIGVLVALIGVIQCYGLLNNIFLAVPARPPSTLANPDFLAVYLLLLSFMAGTFLLQETIRNKKIAYGVALALFLWVIFLTASRAALVGIVIGAIYFGLCYSKKYWKTKSMGVVIIAIIAMLALYFNTGSRFSLQAITSDTRFSVWHIGWKALLAKPILGFGPEQFETAFNTFYDPVKVPYVPDTPFGNWWDRAHNIVLDIGVQAGTLGLLAYFALLGYIFWRLQKTKIILPQKRLVLHGLQATLVGYTIANLFIFDSFSSYLLYFFIIGYSLHLTHNVLPIANPTRRERKSWHGLAIIILGFGAGVFLWQYNITPLYTNAKINLADFLVGSKQCDQGLAIMDGVMQGNTFLYSYARLQYVSFLVTCDTFYPQNDLAYAQKGMAIMQEVAATEPSYARTWLFLGSFENIIASHETDATIKAKEIQDAYNYLKQADTLTPHRQEIAIAKAAVDLTSQNYQAMQTDANACIALNPDLGDCYFTRALSEIYLGQTTQAQSSLTMAKSKHFDVTSLSAQMKLSDAYIAIKDYQALADIYETLTRTMPEIAQYHASLAFAYKMLGKYQQARYEVGRFLQFAPDQKSTADAFLQSLPQ